METVRYPLRTILGLAVATLLSLYGTLEFYGEQIERNQAMSDPYQIAAQEKRFEGLKHVLSGHRVVGYVSDVKAEGAVILSAQYVLAPVILDGTASELVVGNFSRPLDYAEFGRARQLTLVRDFGNGVTLFRKAER